MKLKHLLVFGDSNSFGSEALEDGNCDDPECVNHSYGKFLSSSLSLNYFNFAKSGASNLFIATEVERQLSNFKHISPEEILIIIGWSDSKRIVLECTKSIINVNDGVNLKNFTNASAHVKSFYSFLKTLPFIDETIQGLNQYFFNSEYSLYMDSFIKLGCFSLLKMRNIKFISFPSLPEKYYNGYLNYIKTVPNNVITSYSIKKIKNKEVLIESFNFLEMFKKYGQSQSMFHLKEYAHKQVAIFLKNKLNDLAMI
jgi:hypothetical protein